MARRSQYPSEAPLTGSCLNAVKSVGLSPSTVTFVNLAPSALQAAFASGSVDAASIWNPQATVDVESGARVIAYGRPPLDPDVSFYVGADKDLNDPVEAQRCSPTCSSVSRRPTSGETTTRAAWIQDVEKETGVDEPTAKIVVANGKVLVRYVSADIVKSEQSLADSFFEAKQIPSKVVIGKVVDNLLPVDFSTS